MDRSAFRALLDERVVIADGGTGTSFLERGVPADACFDLLNLTHRDLVREIHTSFIEAGAELIETNTFGANRYRLAEHDAAARVKEINLAGAARAREAGARLVAGSIGPLGVRLAPDGRVPHTAATDAFAEQVQALLEGGVDLVLLETFSDLAEALVAVRAVRMVDAELPIVATLTFGRDDRTLLGETAELVATKLAAEAVDALGANCSEGPEQVLRVLAQMAPHAGGTPLVAQPNAGVPQRRAGRMTYTAAPDYTARYAPAYADVGVRIVGGCCGTRPAHVRALAAALADPGSVERIVVSLGEQRDVGGGRSTGPLGVGEISLSGLAQAFADGRRVVTVELEPPHGPSPARMIAAAETLRDAGATTVNVADSPRAQLRMAPWAAAYLIQTEADLETILHFPTRGRNLLRIQGDLLAAHALGLRNLFAMMGDPTRPGELAGVDLGEVTPSGLIALVTQGLNAGVDRAGASIGEPTRFSIGCAVNPNADDLDREVRVLHRKITSGAAFAMTQPVFDASRLDALRTRYEDAYGPLALPILVGILPLASRRHAEFLHNEVPGIEIGESIRDRIGRATDERAEGAEIAAELAEATRGASAGVYLIPAFRRYDAAAGLIERLR